MASVLACGPGAVLSHRAAAALWGIRGGARPEVTMRRGRKPRPGIALHWADLPADEVTAHDGVPTTTVPRTLLDLMQSFTAMSSGARSGRPSSSGSPTGSGSAT
jgi:hypothetical protein